MSKIAKKQEQAYVSINVDCLDARDLEFKKLPEGVAICQCCYANGKFRQWYCDAGTTTGPCDNCGVTGFVYETTGRGVPLSVLNQIAVANGFEYRRYEPFGLDWTNPKAVNK